MRYVVKDRLTGDTIAMDEMPYSELRDILRDMTGDPDKIPEIVFQNYAMVAVVYADKTLDLDDRDIR